MATALQQADVAGKMNQTITTLETSIASVTDKVADSCDVFQTIGGTIKGAIAGAAAAAIGYANTATAAIQGAISDTQKAVQDGMKAMSETIKEVTLTMGQLIKDVKSVYDNVVQSVNGIISALIGLTDEAFKLIKSTIVGLVNSVNDVFKMAQDAALAAVAAVTSAVSSLFAEMAAAVRTLAIPGCPLVKSVVNDMVDGVGLDKYKKMVDDIDPSAAIDNAFSKMGDTLNGAANGIASKIDDMKNIPSMNSVTANLSKIQDTIDRMQSFSGIRGVIV